MAKHTVSGIFDSAYIIDVSNDRWTFTKGFRSNSDEHGVYVATSVPNTTVEMLGKINAPQRGIFSEADNTTVTIARTGMVSGNMLGVSVEGDDGTIVNHGAVKSTNGIYLVAMGGDETLTTNQGSIKGGVYAYFGSDGDDTLINHGRMEGKIALGNGHDVLDTRGGKVIAEKNEIEGGIGDDTLITDDRKYVLKEAIAEGIDTVKSTVSYTLADHVERLVLLGKKDLQGEGSSTDNDLHGNRGDNFLDGDAGADHLFGHGGDDQLRGGEGTDTFHFSTGDGRDAIIDFEDGVDLIDLTNWDRVNNFERVLSQAFERDGDVIIESGRDSLRIWDVTLNDLNEGDFVFPT